jgi:putative hydrolase of the HAD superfamily
LTRPRAVIFDYGHTLVSFQLVEENLLPAYEEIRRMLEAYATEELPGAEQLVHAVARRIGRAVETSYLNRELEELDIVALYEEALGSLGLVVPRELVVRIGELEHRKLAERLICPAENLHVLRSIRDLGLRVGIVSNAHFLPSMMWEDIRRLGIAEFVDEAVFSASIRVRKPHAAIFQHVLDGLGVAADAAVFVGDRLRDDIAGAKALGMRGVLTRQYRQEELGSYPVVPDLVIDRLPDLVPWVESLLTDS